MLEQDSEQAKKHGDKGLRDFNILLYFLLECAKAVIYSILLYIVTKYSTEKKRQEDQQNEYLNEKTEAFIQEMNNRTSGMLSNALHETDGESEQRFQTALDKLLNELAEDDDEEDDQVIMHGYMRMVKKFTVEEYRRSLSQRSSLSHKYAAINDDSEIPLSKKESVEQLNQKRLLSKRSLTLPKYL